MQKCCRAILQNFNLFVQTNFDHNLQLKELKQKVAYLERFGYNCFSLPFLYLFFCALSCAFRGSF